MPNCEDERNAYPVERQKEATVQETVCGLNALLENENRTHRHVGYKNSVSRFHMLTMSKCNQLSNELMNGQYTPSKGEMHEVFEPKYRITMSSKYRDRIPQSSFIQNYYYPEVVPNLSDRNCACIKGRGVDYARNLLKDILRNAKMTDWCLKVDMKSYFASIDHEKLYEELKPYLKDQWVLSYFQQTVENASSPVGLDLGSEVYQLAATSFMNVLDHKLDHSTYVRYQDDLIFIGSKVDCWNALKTVREEAERLGLTVHEKKTYLQPVTKPIRFLGFTFLRHETGRITLKRNVDRLRNERRKLKKMKVKEIPIERVEEHYQSVRAYMKKGSRSDLMKLDKYYNSLFGGVTNVADS